MCKPIQGIAIPCAKTKLCLQKLRYTRQGLHTYGFASNGLYRPVGYTKGRTRYPCLALPCFPCALSLTLKLNMDTLFYLFSSLALLSAIMVIQASNPVHSVLFLILVFLNSAGLLLLLGLDFFAMLFLVVYVGAIAVLFLFVVMMLNVKSAEISEKKLRYLPVGGLLGLLFLAEIVYIVDNDLIPVLSINEMINTTDTYLSPFTDSEHSLQLCNENGLKGIHERLSTPTFYNVDYTPSALQWHTFIESRHNIESIGIVMCTYYLLLFLLASLILLVAMIGAILLTMHKTVSTKRQQVYQQNNREFAKTVYKMVE
jgi:NADH-ubiquinone oxidoreductase chain 6